MVYNENKKKQWLNKKKTLVVKKDANIFNYAMYLGNICA